MKMYERNPGQGRTALLIHPMLSSAEGIELCVTNFWGEGVHCFVPDLSGHGEDAAATYHSAAEEAKAIHDVLVEQGCTHLDLGFGASLGGVVLFEMLKFPDLTFDHVFFEGVSFYEKAPLIEFVLTRVFLSKHRKAVHRHERGEHPPYHPRLRLCAAAGTFAGDAEALRFCLWRKGLRPEAVPQASAEKISRRSTEGLAGICTLRKDDSGIAELCRHAEADLGKLTVRTHRSGTAPARRQAAPGG